MSGGHESHLDYDAVHSRIAATNSSGSSDSTYVPGALDDYGLVIGERRFQALAFLTAEGDVGVAPHDQRRQIGDVGQARLDLGDRPFHLHATSSGFEVGPHDGRALDATVRADPSYVLAPAAGALTLSDARTLGLVEIDGDESVVRAVFAA
ncbi:hypothetical protein [Nocardia goodfellowii]|uniref:Uncharacterized protein n=1 Tax=Nocardia goodfellowii TaxID=882446 RepID=A0ABS4QNP3_9NOCA|nr:hypothetical protein [Nocardia goodfellowii]MBP2193322.1 hypothetical protein [Nocardia goodfellowii]